MPLPSLPWAPATAPPLAGLPRPPSPPRPPAAAAGRSAADNIATAVTAGLAAALLLVTAFACLDRWLRRRAARQFAAQQQAGAAP